MASRVMTSGVGRSGSPRPRLMLPGFARSEIFRIMLFSMPRRNGGGWKGFIALRGIIFCAAGPYKRSLTPSPSIHAREYAGVKDARKDAGLFAQDLHAAH